MSLNPIRADAVHFGSVLGENTFEIPELQRPYAWQERQAEDFVNDVVKLLVAVRGKGDGSDGYVAEHLFGTVVVLTPKNVGERASVIDGQQRLTTVSITLGLLEHEMRRLAEQVEAAGGPQSAAIVSRLEDNARNINSKLWRQGVDANQPPVLRLLTSPEIRQTYEQILKGESLRNLPAAGARQPAILLVDAATIIRDKLIQHPEFFDGKDVVEKQRHLTWLMNAIFDQLLFVLISTPSNSAAYDLFEVLNARGEELNTLDLLKTWIMSSMADDPRRNAVYAKLKDLVEDPENQLEFLDDFFRARVFRSLGEYDPIPNALECRKSLFSEPEKMRTAGRADPASLQAVCDKIVTQIDLMSQWFPLWKKLDETTWPYDTVSPTGQQSLTSLVDVLGCKIASPLLLQAAANLESQEFEKLLHLVEKTFFRYKTVCSGPVGALEKVFYEIIRILDTNQSLDMENASRRLQSLLDQHANDSAFSNDLEEFVYQPGARARRLKYFLWQLDRYSANPAPAPLALDLDKFQIEHVAPRNPQSNRLTLANVDSIGNLCILTAQENQQLGNLDFDAKLQKINEWKGNGSYLTAKLSRKIFEEHTRWDENEVATRSKALKHQACQVFRVADDD